MPKWGALDPRTIVAVAPAAGGLGARGRGDAEPPLEARSVERDRGQDGAVGRDVRGDRFASRLEAFGWLAACVSVVFGPLLMLAVRSRLVLGASLLAIGSTIFVWIVVRVRLRESPQNLSRFFRVFGPDAKERSFWLVTPTGLLSAMKRLRS